MDELEKKIFTRFKRMVQKERDAFLHQMEEQMDELMDEVKSTTKTASSYISQAPITLYEVNTNTCTSVPVGTEKLSSALADLNKELSQAAQKAYTKEKIFYEQLKAYVDTGIEESQEAVHKAMDEASKALNDAVADIKEGADEVMMKMEDIVKEIQNQANTIVDEVQNQVNNVVDEVQNQVNTVVDEVQNQVNIVVEEVKDTFEELKQAFKDAINQVMDALEDLWHQIEDLFQNGLSLDNLDFDFSLFDSFPATNSEAKSGKEKDKEDHGSTVFNGLESVTTVFTDMLSQLSEATPSLSQLVDQGGAAIDAIGHELGQVLTKLEKTVFSGELKPLLSQCLGDIVDSPAFEALLKAPTDPKDLLEALNIDDPTAVLDDLISSGNDLISGENAAADCLVTSVGDAIGTILDFGTDLIP